MHSPRAPESKFSANLSLNMAALNALTTQSSMSGSSGNVVTLPNRDPSANPSANGFANGANGTNNNLTIPVDRTTRGFSSSPRLGSPRNLFLGLSQSADIWSSGACPYFSSVPADCVDSQDEGWTSGQGSAGGQSTSAPSGYPHAAHALDSLGLVREETEFFFFFFVVSVDVGYFLTARIHRSHNRRARYDTSVCSVLGGV
jgi:hypothetical protein